jgi:hypothetical protein
MTPSTGLAALAPKDYSVKHSFAERGWAMKYSKPSLAVITVFFLSLGIGKLGADDAGLASQTLAAAQTAKARLQCINYCRSRYRDCLHLDQLPSFECRSIYQDCTQYSCTGLGPG